MPEVVDSATCAPEAPPYRWVTIGAASDGVGREPAYSCGAVLVVVAIVVPWLVPTFHNDAVPYLYAVLLGAGYVSSSAMPPLLTADMFRGPAYAAIFGGIQLASNAGSGIGALLAGYIYDRSGSYHIPLFAPRWACSSARPASGWRRRGGCDVWHAGNGGSSGQPAIGVRAEPTKIKQRWTQRT